MIFNNKKYIDDIESKMDLTKELDYYLNESKLNYMIFNNYKSFIEMDTNTVCDDTNITVHRLRFIPDDEKKDEIILKMKSILILQDKMYEDIKHHYNTVYQHITPFEPISRTNSVNSSISIKSKRSVKSIVTKSIKTKQNGKNNDKKYEVNRDKTSNFFTSIFSKK